MKLSVIIPCYNFGQYIEQSILSAVNQHTNFQYEILIRDDMSSDCSNAIIERVCSYWCHGKNIKNFRPDINLGANKNIRFILEQATGEYIAYLDGDDYWTDPYKLQKQVDFLESNKDYALTFTGYLIRRIDETYYPDDPHCWVSISPNLNGREPTTLDLIDHNWLGYGRVFKNANNLIKDWMLDLPILDWPLNYEISKLGKIKYMDFPSGIYRTNKESAFSILSAEDQFKRGQRTRLAIREDYKRMHPEYDINSPF